MKISAFFKGEHHQDKHENNKLNKSLIEGQKGNLNISSESDQVKGHSSVYKGEHQSFSFALVDPSKTDLT